MVETVSKMLPLGTKAPDFCLQDTMTGKFMKLVDLASSTATVVMFICNHCPYVLLIREKLIEVAKTYQAKGISFIAISSNDPIEFPADGPEAMRAEANSRHFPFPYLFDDTQEVAKSYHAACTPDFFVFDKDLLCVYRGRFDDAKPRNDRPVTGSELSAALDNILANKPVAAEQIPSIGCNIKWKK